ncbi:putative NAD-dependent histone deacetylase [Triangularia setosa]|uniref:NAD-dependent histone deacetylase n=1 Tax=Triangularia setosa TaxID=2587417 RepID=A0AAN6W820_9PEZI|nr:putative NAD-dependent histone deacetylase [Podospora setosa]
MPTTHVEPGSEALLEEIANSLWKSKKVVVITGAGISTNSGIPDFRSENGLYSLIQAQFDAAERQQDLPSSASDASDSSLEQRPTKRRRASHDLPRPVEGTGLPGQWPQNTSQNTIIAEQGHGVPSADPVSSDPTDDPSAQPATPRDTSAPQEDVTLRDVENSEHAPGPPTAGETGASYDAEKLAEPSLSRGLTPLPSPRLKVPEAQPEITPGRITMGTSASFTSSPPSMAIDALRLRSRTDLLAHTRSSSPLSSPPPISYDPYQESVEESSCSSSSGSSRSESEEPSSVSTPLLTSQTSYGSSSSRTSLPNMKGKDLFDAQIWSCPLKTSVFYTFATTLRNKVRTAQPTNSHRFVSILRDSRKLVRCYTQNIDQLEERVGLSTSLLLGAGSRYRFSARAGRSSAGGRSSLKGPEVSDLSTDGCSLQDSEQPPRSQAEPESQELKEETGNGEPEGKREQDGSGSDSSQALPSSSQPPSSQSAPSGPKRGVECVFLHGSLAELRCFVCAKTATWEDEQRQAETLAGRQPTCPHCAGATAAREEKGKRALGVGKLRPDIVLYGEEHPHAHLISPLVQHDLSLGPDMLLILGTSMRVHGLKVLVREFAKAVHDRGGKVVFVNFTKPPESVWADVLDFWVQWDCDAWVEDLQHRKPALWLPPGTVLPDQVKTKGVKASRRQSGGETGKRKEQTETASKKRKESDGPIRKKQKRESGGVADSVTVALDPADVREPSPPPVPEVSVITAKASESSPPPPPPPPARPEVVREIPRLRPEAPPRLREMTITTDMLPPPVPLPGPSPLSMSMTISPPPELTPSAPPSPPTVPVIPELKPIPRRPVSRVTREPKLNPDAKRPASIRDHKLNGAYLTFKILGDLKRITGEPPISFYTPSPSPIASRPKAKRTRKSAPVVLHGNNLESSDSSLVVEDDVDVDASNVLFRKNAKVKGEPHASSINAPVDVLVDQGGSSISAMVKSRRRKRTAWRMIGGVETQVSLDDNGEVVLPMHLPLPHTAATFKPLSSPSFRALPEPRPTPVASPVTYQPSSNPFASIENGFQDTDRLIDKLREQSRPSTPLRFEFPPLNIPAPTEQSPPKLETLEPKVTSPGPLTANSVMSPIFAKPRNPFFFADPLAGGLVFPPSWYQHHQHHHQATTSVERTTSQQSAANHHRRGSWNPEDQLRQEEREREVAMMLTTMSTASILSHHTRGIH